MATVLARNSFLQRLIGAMSLDSFRERLLTYEPEKLIVVVGDRQDILQMVYMLASSDRIVRRQ